MNSRNPVIALLMYRRWWQFIAPLPVALAVVAAGSSAPVRGALLWEILAFLISTLALGSYGFLLNDLCDRDADRIAGKRNVAASMGGPLAAAWCVVLLILGMVPWWVVLNASATARGLVLLQVALLTCYSVPPFRFKTRGALGVVADALYGHTLPPLIAWCAFYRLPLSPFLRVTLVVAVLALFAKGLRNIVTHQLEDRHCDRQARSRTLLSACSGERALALVWRVFLPVEIGFLAVLALLVLPRQPGVLLALATFLALSEWRIRHGVASPRGARTWFRERYFLNLFYETWLPLYLLVAAVSQEFSLVSCGVIYLALFPRTFAEAILPFDALRYTQRASQWN